jgi:ribose transport system ATP-binding protein
MTDARAARRNPPPTASPLLVMRGIAKSFPGVDALVDVDVELHAGEVLALVGENGAGKSTLIKVLAGAHEPDAGSIAIDGRPIDLPTPHHAQQAGIAVIYQELNLVPSLTARENIFLGHEPRMVHWIRRRAEQARARELFGRMGVRIDPEAMCRSLSVAQQQVVEIAKALSLEARILVMDEPSATLTTQEVERLFAVIGELKRHGIAIIYISHRLDEVFDIADRVMVLRDGRHIATEPVGEVDRERLIELMVGRRLENEFPPRERRVGEVRLAVRHLRRGDEVRDVSFEVHRGEVLALTGLVGAGRSETARLIFGADRRDAGEMELDGEPLHVANPREAIRRGICLLSEDRKGEGLVLGQTARENFALPNLGRLSRLGFMRRGAESSAFARYVGELSIRLAHPEQAAQTLSGGNQQKLVLAKWLESNSEVIIFDEPTRGIDVGAKYEIYQLINRLAGQGKAIVLISSEFPEVLGMADRILVMHDGRITGEIDDVAGATQEQILTLAVA